MSAQHGDAADETDQEPPSDRRRRVDEGHGRPPQPLVGLGEDERKIPVVDHCDAVSALIASISAAHPNTSSEYSGDTADNVTRSAALLWMMRRKGVYCQE